MGASGFELVDVVEIGEGTEAQAPDDEVDATFRDLVYTYDSLPSANVD